MLHGMGNAVAKEPQNGRWDPTESFISNRMRAERRKARARRKKNQQGFGVAVIECDPPGDERAIQDPPERAHIAEPDDGFVAIRQLKLKRGRREVVTMGEIP